VRQDEIRPHVIGIRAACASIDYDRMQVVACTNLMWTEVDTKAPRQPRGSPFHAPCLGQSRVGTIIQGHARQQKPHPHQGVCLSMRRGQREALAMIISYRPTKRVTQSACGRLEEVQRTGARTARGELSSWHAFLLPHQGGRDMSVPEFILPLSDMCSLGQCVQTSCRTNL
jgi:hypothetical protein